ncbi:hypothetical protein C7293_00190 [filamentous cyanobacterium CCT1]|nr:hypothetical protein C7293_00190 [filamentous cyanobacterium CCT1]PSN81460.1 hypothetical protein C8B47_01130 [filamentous cyanobacterium CCP4]
MEIKLDTHQFLERFFGDDNQIKLNAIESVDGSAHMLQPWIARLEQGLPSVLPYGHDQGTDWYGVAQSERQLRGLREDLTAFVGPTWSTFRGQRAQLNLGDPVEASIYAFTGGLAFKFQGDSDGDGKSREIWQALELMRQVLDRRVAQTYETPRATGRVLRDFYMALQACDRPAAEHQLHYLKTHNRLDPQNLLFLKVRMLSDLEEWEELLALPELPDLLGTRRPYEVTQSLIRTVYQQELYRFESTKAVQSAVTYFHESIFPKYSSLYTARANSRQPEIAKSFMLLAVGGETPNSALRDELLSIPGLRAEDQAYLEQLANISPTQSAPPSTVVADPLKEAEEAGQRLAWDEVFEFASQAPPSLRKAQLLFQVFYELETLDTQREALNAYRQLSTEDQEALGNTRLGQNCLKHLRGDEKTTEQIPDNWLNWLQQLQKNPGWDLALDIARRGEKEWDITQLLEESGATQKFANLLKMVGGDTVSGKTLANALPHFLGAFQSDDEYPRREFAPIYAYLLDLLAFNCEGGDPDLGLFNDLVIALLYLGVNQSTYQEIVGYGLDLWDQYSSPAKVDWVLDFINILVLQPCPEEEIRSRLLFAAATTLRQFSGRIDEVQWSLFAALVQDLNLQTSFPDLPPQEEISGEPTETSILQQLTNKTILIYTLTEPVAQRVKAFLEKACEGIKVHLSHAKGGSDQLKMWVTNDDLVIMVTASAKHAATNFIEKNRGELPLLRVNTKGSASILREVRSYLYQFDTNYTIQG